MSRESTIEWTQATWNPVRGCTKVSPGCKHCYAETFAERFRGVKGNAYEQGFDLRLVPEKLGEPLRWTKPRRIFVNSMSDLFQEGVPFDFIVSCFEHMQVADHHAYQILTKRHDRLVAFLARAPINPMPHVTLGVSIENQEWADKRFPSICAVGEHRWNTMVSLEPLLGPVSIPAGYLSLGRRAWVIVGAESGLGARPMSEDWVRSIRDQCVSARVPFFYKQRLEAGHKVSLPTLDGRQWMEITA
jgi:protein gp37